MLTVRAEGGGAGVKAPRRPLEALAEEKNLPLAFLEAQGLRDGPGGSVFVPYLDHAGNPLFDRERRRGHPRFMQPRGTRLRAYGLWRLADQPHGLLYLTEGETDALTLWHYGWPALGLPGAETVRSALQAEELDKVHDLYVVPDNDEPGEAFVKNTANRLAELRWKGKLWRLRLPACAKDVSHLHTKGDPPFARAWEAMLSAAEAVEFAPAHNTNGRRADGPPRERPSVLTMSQLMALDLPEPRWVVPGLLSEGLTILAGKPKLGKSWCALNVALTVAGGGMVLGNIKAQPADVLYLSLEDRLRRVQDRARKVLGGLGAGAPERLHVAVEWPRQDQGGLDEIERWLDDHEGAALVIVDVWQKFRPATNNRSGAYEQDYAAVGALKATMDSRKVSCLLIHHCKKAREEDAVSEISGTNGIAGAADGIIVLTRARNENEGQLYITGRDVEEKKLAVAFDPQTFVWKSLGDAEERVQSELGQRVINLLRGAGSRSAYFPKEIHDLLNLEGREGHVRKVMQRLTEKGIVERNGTRYRWPADAAFTPDPDEIECGADG